MRWHLRAMWDALFIPDIWLALSGGVMGMIGFLIFGMPGTAYSWLAGGVLLAGFAWLLNYQLFLRYRR